MAYNFTENTQNNKPSKFTDITPIANFVILDLGINPEKFPFDYPYMNEGVIFTLVIDGHCKANINFKEYKASKNTVLILPPRSVIKITERTDNLDIKAFFLSYSLVYKLQLMNDYDIVNTISQNPRVRIDKKTMSELLDFYSFIIKQHHAIDKLYQEDMTNALLFSFNLKMKSIYKLNLSTTSEHSTKHEIRVGNFIRLLLNNYKQERNISFYAEKLNLTPRYLSAIVKKVLGKPFYFWLNEIVLIDAKFQLKRSNKTIKEISESLNFATSSLFGRFFKKEAGITPLNFRNE